MLKSRINRIYAYVHKCVVNNKCNLTKHTSDAQLCTSETFPEKMKTNPEAEACIDWVKKYFSKTTKMSLEEFCSTIS